MIVNFQTNTFMLVQLLAFYSDSGNILLHKLVKISEMSPSSVFYTRVPWNCMSSVTLFIISYSLLHYSLNLKDGSSSFFSFPWIGKTDQLTVDLAVVAGKSRQPEGARLLGSQRFSRCLINYGYILTVSAGSYCFFLDWRPLKSVPIHNISFHSSLSSRQIAHFTF